MRKPRPKQQKLAQQQRSQARLAAVQALYQQEVGRTPLEDLLDDFRSHHFLVAQDIVAQETAADENVAPPPAPIAEAERASDALDSRGVGGPEHQSLYALTGSTMEQSITEQSVAEQLGILPSPMESLIIGQPDDVFFERLVRGAYAQCEAIDRHISARLEEGWALSRLDKAMVALLRAAVYELLACLDVPKAVVVDEYVTIAQGFFVQREVGFVNGLLDRVGTDLRGDSGDSLPLKAADTIVKAAETMTAASHHATEASETYKEIESP